MHSIEEIKNIIYNDYVESNLLIEQKVNLLEVYLEELKAKQYEDQILNYAEDVLTALKKEKDKFYEEMFIEIPLTDFKMTFPKYFQQMEMEFNNFFSFWQNHLSNKSELLEGKQKIFSMIVSQVMQKIEPRNRYRDVIIENEEDNKLNSKDISQSILNYWATEPYMEIFQLASIIIISLTNEHKTLKELVDDLNFEKKMWIKTEELKNSKIKELLDKIKKIQVYKKRPARGDMIRLADQCKFKNGNINYSKLGRLLGVNHKTAKEWVKKLIPGGLNNA